VCVCKWWGRLGVCGCIFNAPLTLTPYSFKYQNGIDTYKTYCTAEFGFGLLAKMSVAILVYRAVI